MKHPHRRAARFTATAVFVLAATAFTTSSGALAQPTTTTPPATPSTSSPTTTSTDPSTTTSTDPSTLSPTTSTTETSPTTTYTDPSTTFYPSTEPTTSAPTTPPSPTTSTTTTPPTSTTVVPTSPTRPGIFELPTLPKNPFTDPDGIIAQVIFKNPLPKPSGTPSEAPAIAQAQAQTVQQAFGGESVGSLVVDKAFQTGQGATVRLRQQIDSVPVFGATVAQSLAADGSLTSASGALSHKVQGKYPAGVSTPPAAVAATALRTLATETKQPRDKFAIGATVAMWYDAKLAARSAAAGTAVPAYKVTVKSAGAQGKQPVQWVVFVDANNTGRVLDGWRESEHPDRDVCEAGRTPADPDGRPETLASRCRR